MYILKNYQYVNLMLINVLSHTYIEFFSQILMFLIYLCLYFVFFF